MTTLTGRALPIIVAIAPSLIGLIAFSAIAGGQWHHFVPYWNDEVVHWHQAATFSARFRSVRATSWRTITKRASTLRR
jgi:hypothetical protein